MAAHAASSSALSRCRAPGSSSSIRDVLLDVPRPPLAPQQPRRARAASCQAHAAAGEPGSDDWRQLQRQPQQLVAAASPPQQLWASWQRQLQQQPQCGRPRRRVVAGAGRRRRQTSLAPPSGDGEDDQVLADMDDVMYAGEGIEGEEELGAADDDEAEDEYEFEDEEEDEELEEEQEEDWVDEGAEEAEADAEASAVAAEAELDSWDAALANFDTAQDAVAAPAPPSKEEQERAAALAMVRFDQEDAEEDGTSLIVSEVPAAVPYRPKTFEEQTSELSLEDQQTLTANKASYVVFPMFFLDLLIESTPDGRLMLANCFALDTLDEVFMRPTVGPGVPAEPSLYQVLPWEHVQTGDVLKDIEPQVSIIRLYFVALHSASPHDVDMRRVYSFEASTRSFEVHEVQVLGDVPLEQMEEPTLRIREDGVFVEEAALMPGTWFVAEGFAGHPAEVYANPDKQFDIFEHVKMGMWDQPPTELLAVAARARANREAREAAAAAAAAAGEAGAPPPPGPGLGLGLGLVDRGGDDGDAESGLEERLEELELMEELDDMPDVPAVDMM